MSDLDKTSQQLLASIRKTKEGPSTAAVKSAAPKKTTRKVAKPKAKTAAATAKPKPTAKKAPAKTKAAESKKTRSVAAKPKELSPRKMIVQMASTEVQVPYSDGSQVWPD